MSFNQRNFPIGGSDPIQVTIAQSSIATVLPRRDAPDLMIVNEGAATVYAKLGSIAKDAAFAASDLTYSANAEALDTVQLGDDETYEYHPASDFVGAPAKGDLIIETLPTAGSAVRIGDTVYTFKLAVAAAPATGILTFSGNVSDGDKVFIGGLEYTFKDTLAETTAEGVLTLTAQPIDQDTVTLGGTTYTFQSILTSSPNNVLIGAAATNTIDNLIAAINKDVGEGTLYGVGTVANADATAAAGTGDAMDATAINSGLSGNAIATSVEAFTAAFSWGDLGLRGGSNIGAPYSVLIGGGAAGSVTNLVAAILDTGVAGTNYGIGTEENPDISAADGTGDTIDATALVAGDAGNSITTTEVASNLLWGAGTLTGGATAGLPNDVLRGVDVGTAANNLIAAINKGAGEGTVYGDGTQALSIAAGSLANTSELDLGSQPANGNTVTLGGTTYTFQTVLVDAADNVLIGGNQQESLENLAAAINADAGAGTIYGTGTVANPDAYARKLSGTSMQAVDIGGAAPAATDTLSNGNWSANPLAPANVVRAEATEDGADGNDIITTTSVVDAIWEDSTFIGGLDDGGQPFWVLIGASATDSLSNLAAAISASASDEGTLFGNDTPANSVARMSVAGLVGTATALSLGSEGNSIPTVVTPQAGSSFDGFWTGATLTGGDAAGTVVVTTAGDGIPILAGEKGVWTITTDFLARQPLAIALISGSGSNVVTLIQGEGV